MVDASAREIEASLQRVRCHPRTFVGCEVEQPAAVLLENIPGWEPRAVGIAMPREIDDVLVCDAREVVICFICRRSVGGGQATEKIRNLRRVRGAISPSITRRRSDIGKAI